MAMSWFNLPKSISGEGQDQASGEKAPRIRSQRAAAAPRPEVEDDRTGATVETLRRAIADNLYYIQGKTPAFATLHDVYMALAYTVRDRMVHRWIATVDAYLKNTPKTVYYLSAEFLMGRQLLNSLLCLGLRETAEKALRDSGYDLAELAEQEAEPGLGNGGLGRLAACYLDSLATHEYPAVGYGIRYEFGIFEQVIRNGWQVERPERWLSLGNPWELRRPERTCEVKLGGVCERRWDQKGRLRAEWRPERTVVGMAYDTLVPGYGVNTVNTLRLWSAGASNEFDFAVFNAGDFTRAVAEITYSENISKVLYPNDHTPQGKELRLKQQYFFVSCSLQDMLRFFFLGEKDLRRLPERCAVQLNDTHPATAVAELMRLLLDEHGLEWEAAWETTHRTFGYTNHTLLAEALERWPVELFGRLLPRHMEIVYEINRRFMGEVQLRFPGDGARMARLSLIEEGPEKQVRMAHLAAVGSHAVNGVAALHGRLLREEVLKDFYELWPDKFSHKTNGITPRRWLLLCNPRLAALISDRIGTDWVRDAAGLKKLEAFADDPRFCKAWAKVRRENKEDLARYIKDTLFIEVDTASLFDVQVKRIHEYKRQLLNLFHIITLYNRIRMNPAQEIVPRTFILAGKAAPGCQLAKLIIKLAGGAAMTVNADPAVRGRLRVVFLPNFNVSLGEKVYPAADLAEQISTAGKEASGTGSMKFALHGALTIGTYDGANIEIREAVGEENFFLCGAKMEDLERLRAGGYVPLEYYQGDSELRYVVDQIASGWFSPDEPNVFEPLVDSLLGRDPCFVFADYRSYLKCQEEAGAAFRKSSDWTRASILNTARAGFFSSDRAVREYAGEIWGIKPQPAVMRPYLQAEAGLKRGSAAAPAPLFSIKD